MSDLYRTSSLTGMSEAASSSNPQTVISAIDMLIQRGQDTNDFTKEELEKIRRARAVCVKDMELIQEAHVLLSDSRDRLKRKEDSLSVFMENLSPSDLDNPVIKKMLEYFMQSHIELDGRISQMEQTLASMYPNWTTGRDCTINHCDLKKNKSVGEQLGEALEAIDQVEGSDDDDVAPSLGRAALDEFDMTYSPSSFGDDERDPEI